MKQRYRLPTVYRWVIYEIPSKDIEAIYIGEAQVLCPNRLSNYLRPGKTQRTSQRVNNLLKAYIDQGKQVQLEKLDFEAIELQAFRLTSQDLSAKNVRRLIEELFVTLYRQYGIKVLNL
jgi:hypothetical protein